MNIEEIVMKLIGNINPIGESNEDAKRLENLKQLTELTDCLVSRINRIRECKGDHRYSMNMAGQHAHNFLSNLRDELIES